MLRSIKVVFYMALFVVTLFLGNGLRPAALSADGELEKLATTRSLLTEKLLSLDFERLATRDFNWLESLGVNYDYDNQQYFLEFSSDATHQDSTILLTIDFADKESVEVRLFAPEEHSYLWMRCRLRATKERLYINYVFHPQNNKTKIFSQTFQRSPALAAAIDTSH